MAKKPGIGEEWSLWIWNGVGMMTVKWMAKGCGGAVLGFPGLDVLLGLFGGGASAVLRLPGFALDLDAILDLSNFFFDSGTVVCLPGGAVLGFPGLDVLLGLFGGGASAVLRLPGFALDLDAILDLSNFFFDSGTVVCLPGGAVLGFPGLDVLLGLFGGGASAVLRLPGFALDLDAILDLSNFFFDSGTVVCLPGGAVLGFPGLDVLLGLFGGGASAVLRLPGFALDLDAILDLSNVFFDSGTVVCLPGPNSVVGATRGFALVAGAVLPLFCSTSVTGGAVLGFPGLDVLLGLFGGGASAVLRLPGFALDLDAILDLSNFFFDSGTVVCLPGPNSVVSPLSDDAASAPGLYTEITLADGLSVFGA
ncbi:hypothetical protein Pmani_015754 [Petrolisthes manimaculis]|uniref:Uncharacterized protein n=1 Tax=Petrolisthes manimaculis TaxID=1843537 RepID=A0AAE1UBS1_9EUCA|nr:hypothetical protein Pmani_015754 [Petrolisthes manimaculis]